VTAGCTSAAARYGGTVSLHDALPILSWVRAVTVTREGASARSARAQLSAVPEPPAPRMTTSAPVRAKWPSGRKSFSARSTVIGRSEEHTSELQSREKLVCRLLLEKKK